MSIYSYVLYPGNGVQTDFSFSFPYLDTTHIQVRVNGVTAAFTWLNANTIKLNTAAPSGQVVEIKRVTVQDTAPVDFTDGSVLREVDLDKLVLFATYAAQESMDSQLRAIYQKANGDFTAGNFRITDVAAPVNPTDAVNKSYFDDTYAPQLAVKVAAAASSAAAASASEVSALTASANSSSKAAQADASAGTATAAASQALSYVQQALGFTASTAYDLGSVADPLTLFPTNLGTVP